MRQHTALILSVKTNINVIATFYVIVMSDEPLGQQILKHLQEVYPMDKSIEEISQALGIGRDTVSKYVRVLQAEGKVIKKRTIGSAKMFVFKQE